MKLLFDQNISYRIVAKLDDRFKDCKQVKHLGLEDSTDLEIWKFSKEQEFSIVTFDSDFYDISLINNFPPKIIWLRGGNMPTPKIAVLIQSHFQAIVDFLHNEQEACLEIY